mmetsp:Transcript_58125/g.169943  ORF Transcript_58125/g.169943 Transcript_58125/m.169943 type:complete len:513 (-) Transcript_58125:75-1613(-)
MASSAEMQGLFLNSLPEAEEAPELCERLPPKGRRLGGLRDRRMVLLAGVAMAACACIGLALWPREKAPPGAELASAEVMAEEKIKPFQQCGGEGWTNGTCCVAGCACVAETRYYSQCKAPEGLQDCDHKRASVEKEAADTRVSSRKDDLDQREAEVKAASDNLESAKKARVKAEAEAEKATHIAEVKERHLKASGASAGRKRKAVEDEANGELDKVLTETKATLAEKTKSATELRDHKLKVATDARTAAETAAKEARAAFDDANKAAADKTKERSIVKKHVDDFEAGAKVRKEKQCGGLFGSCTASNCCQLGCQPYWQNKYFCQCEGPNHAHYCAAKEQEKQYHDSTDAMPVLTKDWKRLDEANATAAAKTKEADSHFEEVRDKAERDIAAAKEEFATSTKEPADAADKKIKAAKEKAEKKIKAAKEAFDKETKEAREASEKAGAERDAKESIAQSKRNAEEQAAKDAAHAAHEVTQAKMALASAQGAVGSWSRSAGGHPCGRASDGQSLGF